MKSIPNLKSQTDDGCLQGIGIEMLELELLHLDNKCELNDSMLRPQF